MRRDGAMGALVSRPVFSITGQVRLRSWRPLTGAGRQALWVVTRRAGMPGCGGLGARHRESAARRRSSKHADVVSARAGPRLRGRCRRPTHARDQRQSAPRPDGGGVASEASSGRGDARCALPLHSLSAP